MAKNTGIAALQNLGGGANDEPAETVADVVEKPEPTPARVTRAKPSRKPDPRINGTVYMHPEVHDQVRRMAFDRKVKQNTLFLRGLDKLFAETPNMASIKELTGIDVWSEEE